MAHCRTVTDNPINQLTSTNKSAEVCMSLQLWWRKCDTFSVSLCNYDFIIRLTLVKSSQVYLYRCTMLYCFKAVLHGKKKTQKGKICERVQTERTTLIKEALMEFAEDNLISAVSRLTSQHGMVGKNQNSND